MIYNNNIFSGQILRSMTKKFIVGALIGHLSVNDNQVFSEYVYCGNEKKTGNDGVPTLKDFPYRVVIKKIEIFSLLKFHFRPSFCACVPVI